MLVCYSGRGSNVLQLWSEVPNALACELCMQQRVELIDVRHRLPRHAPGPPHQPVAPTGSGIQAMHKLWLQGRVAQPAHCAGECVEAAGVADNPVGLRKHAGDHAGLQVGVPKPVRRLARAVPGLERVALLP